MSPSSNGISALDSLVERLPPRERALFWRIFTLDIAEGYLRPPEEMRGWIQQYFGSVEATTRQRIVKLFNQVTLEGSLFNSLRAQRPIAAKERLGALAQVIDGSSKEPLDTPLTMTPEDTFGRIIGAHTISSANIAKYDGLHGMLIFQEHNPLQFSREQFEDLLVTAWRWVEEAHRSDPSAVYPFFMWNCLWRAGASLIHGHAQVLLGRGSHYAKVEALRRAAQGYRERHGSSYFDDLFQVHRSLGLAFEKEGVRVMSYLTPIKEKEVIFMAPEVSATFRELVYMGLVCFRDSLKAISFNLAIFTPPVTPTPESWDGFPVMGRLVDRGDLSARASDFGTMELYGSSVIASDPFRVAQALGKFLDRASA